MAERVAIKNESVGIVAVHGVEAPLRSLSRFSCSFFWAFSFPGFFRFVL